MVVFPAGPMAKGNLMLSALRDVLEVDVKRVAFGVMAISTAMAMGCGGPECPAGSVVSEGRCVTEGVDAGTDVGQPVDTGPAADVGPPDAAPVDAPTFDVGPIDVGPPGMDSGVDSGMPDAFVPPDTAIDAFTPLDAPQPDACVTATYYADADGDTFGNPSASMTGCVMPAGYVTNSMDCNDGAAVIRPGATEVCNGVDDNCVGGIDEGVQMTLYVDADGDNYGGATTGLACEPRAGLVAMTGDCNDSASAISPGATETCDGMDNNCSGTGDTPTFVCTRNAPSTPCTTTCGSMGVGTCTSSCAAPTGASCMAPAETCNGRDDDCDGRSDESVVAVGSPTTVIAGSANVGPVLVPVASGFVAIYLNSTTLWFVSVSDAGLVGTPQTLTTASGLQYGFSARFDGTANVVLSYKEGSDFKVLAFRASTGSIAWGPFTLPRTGSALVHSQVAEASPGRATVYFQLSSVIRRVRLNTSGATPTVIAAPQDIVGTNNLSMFDVVSTVADGDYVAYRDSAADLRLTRSPIGDSGGAFSPLGIIRTATSAPDMLSVGIAIRNPASTVSSTNPLGVVWQRNGVGTYFMAINNAASPGTGTQVDIGTTGRPYDLFFLANLVDIAAVPSSTGSHFYVSTIERDITTASNGRLNVFEVGTGTPTWRSLAVAGEVPSVRYNVSLARSVDGQFRVASETGTGIVTRSLGCP